MRNRFFFVMIVFLYPISASAQRVVDVDKYEGSALTFFRVVGGEPISNTKFVRLVDGTPYFSDRWMKGNVIVEESEYRNVFLRVNILETSLEFMDQKGEQMVCTMPIKKVVLTDSLKGSQFHFIHSSFLPENAETKQSWLLELASGQAKLYKHEKKMITENRPYNSATTEQRILNSFTYYVLFENQLRRVKKTGDIAELLVSKKSDLLEYIKTNKLSAKDEKDMARLINYYNTL
jgi:hypothetical protein